MTNHLPPNFNTEEVVEILAEHSCQLKISRPRKTKLGDFRASNAKHISPVITINNNLNQYAFAVTLLHEVAHLLTWVKYDWRKIKPHGQEWKQQFKALLVKYIRDFPEDVQDALLIYLQNPKASSCTDTNLQKVLKKYNTNAEVVHLEDIEIGSKFNLNKKTFVSISKLRKRYKCQDVNSKKMYYVSPLAEVALQVSSKEKV
jgi:predicted SprT family Zn-dependent metalloprotease